MYMEYSSFEFGRSNPENGIEEIDASDEIIGKKRNKQEAVRSLALGRSVEKPRFSSSEVGKIEDLTGISKPSKIELESSLQPIHEKSAPKLTKETVRTLEQSPTQELLDVAKNIEVNGTSLRKLYETNQIDRRGLIEILKAVLKGGDAKKVFMEVKLGREAQLGRKIEMRHDDPMFIGQDVKIMPSKAAIKRTKLLSEQLRMAQSQTLVQLQDLETEQTSTVTDVSLEHAQDIMKQKRNVTITITIVVVLSAIAALVWLAIS